MKRINKNTRLWLLAFIITAIAGSCTKARLDDDFEKGTPPPIGGFASSDDVASANLVAKWSFEGNVNESKQNLTGTATGTSFTPGLKGQALQGSTSGYITYPAAGTSIASLKSFTFSFWMNTATNFDGGATQLFQIENSGDFWSNVTIYFESAGINDSTRFRMQFHKEGVTYNNAFLEAKIPPASSFANKWVHIAATYDGATSTYTVYFNSVKMYQTVLLSGPAPSPALGDLNFVNAGRLIFGTWKQKIGAAGDSWMLNYPAKVDEFRIYNKALSPSEISALYQLEKQGN
jgi:hypothetical protein